MKNTVKTVICLLALILVIATVLSGCGFVHISFGDEKELPKGSNIPALHDESFNGQAIIDSVPEFTTSAYVVINDNNPYYTVNDYTTESYEYFSELDSLGRCGVTVANIGKDLMPTEKRESIGSVKPTGWQTVKYDCVDGKYLYNRCHLIGFQLTGENANNKNLITGTRYLNVQGMLPFEDMVADYVKDTENHVLYRVTPLYTGDNLVANGVLMEGYSVEDSGDGICFCVYCYNNQPGIVIDYRNGDSFEGDMPITEKITAETTSKVTTKTQSTTKAEPETIPVDTVAKYILNTSSKKFHLPTCSSVSKISDENRSEFEGTKEELMNQGYTACGTCKP